MVRRPGDRLRGRRVPVSTSWLRGLLEEPELISDMGLPPGGLRNIRMAYARSLCLRCKGKGLCGRPDCPFLEALRLFCSSMPDVGLDLEGNSPPAVFVGRMGYPYVSVGPLVPPLKADTAFFDRPEDWHGLLLAEIIRMRTSLVRGKFVVNVRKPWKAGKLMERTLELALSKGPVGSELYFRRRPKKVLILDEGVQPFGPTGPIRSLEVDAGRWDRRLEKVYSDTDLRASEAVLWLYDRGVPVSEIQRAFSVGAMGLGHLRRLVPTRWSITAVDSIISRGLVERIRDRPPLDRYLVFKGSLLDNHYVIILLPGTWSFELLEAWAPGALWNPSARTCVISDWEGWRGRTTYARPGGSYYAARLAVCEALDRMGRQASAIVMREVGPGYKFPVGVWQVREAVRTALRSRP
ncbi:hypothetical protein DRO32_03390, partial [Candidatus Bathyarchaeota archaeon]